MPLQEQWLPIDLTADEFVAGQDVEHDTFNDIYNRLLYLRRGRAFVDSQGFIEVPPNAMFQLRTNGNQIGISQGQRATWAYYLVYVDSGDEVLITSTTIFASSAAGGGGNGAVNTNIWGLPSGMARLYYRSGVGRLGAVTSNPLNLITFTQQTGVYNRFPPLVEL